MLYSRSVGSIHTALTTTRQAIWALTSAQRARKNGGRALARLFCAPPTRPACLGNSALDVSHSVSTMHSLALGMH